MQPAQVPLLTKAGTVRKRRAPAPPRPRVHRGRPRKPGVPHARRPRHARSTPVHITWKVRRGLRTLRDPELVALVREAFIAGKNRFGFRLVHYSIQDDHMHLLCEAEDAKSLSRGLQGLAIRVARALNPALKRTGKLFKERYHCRSLKHPLEVRRALVYVLQNYRKHHAERLAPRSLARRWLDREASSAQHFDGWADVEHTPPGTQDTVVAPRTWLVTTGWRRHHPPLSTDEVPAPN